jgi:CRP-like cAMP-binding protein
VADPGRRDSREPVSVEQQLAIRAFTAGSFASVISNQLAAVSTEKFFPAGTVIYRQGERSDHVFTLVEGRVELSAEGTDPWYLEAPAVFGVLDVQLDRDHDRTARAVTDLRVMLISIGDWFDVFEDNFEITPPRIRMMSKGLLDLALSMDPPGGFPDAPMSARERPSMMAVLPDSDPRELNPFERLITLRLCPFFERAGTQSLIRLARAAHPTIHRAGAALAVQGTPADSFFIVVCGAVTASRDEPELSAVFSAPQVAGAFAGFGQERWEVSLTATTTTCCLEIRYDDLYDVMEDHFDLVRAIMAHTARERDRLQTMLAPK